MLSILLNLFYLFTVSMSLFCLLMLGILALSLIITFPASVIRVSEKLAFWCLIASTVLALFVVIVGLLHLLIGGGINAL